MYIFSIFSSMKKTLLYPMQHRVDRPITNHLHMIEHLFVSQALEIIFQVQRKMSNEKITR